MPTGEANLSKIVPHRFTTGSVISIKSPFIASKLCSFNDCKCLCIGIGRVHVFDSVSVIPSLSFEREANAWFCADPKANVCCISVLHWGYPGYASEARM